MLPHYLWKVKVRICDKLRAISTFSQSVIVSVGISKLSLTDLIFVDTWVKVNGGYYWDVLLSHAIFSYFNKTAHLHTGHVTLCDFLSNQHLLSFLQICGRRITPTLIRSIRRYGMTSSSECISRSCTALMN